MPRGDRTGPAGLGPQTGRGVGYCAGNDVPGYATAGRRGFGGGRGRRGSGRRFRNRGARFADTQREPTESAVTVPSQEDEVASLRKHADEISASLRDIQSRIAELDAGAPPETPTGSVDA